MAQRDPREVEHNVTHDFLGGRAAHLARGPPVRTVEPGRIAVPFTV
jgi:hypothetical protein